MKTRTSSQNLTILTELNEEVSTYSEQTEKGQEHGLWYPAGNGIADDGSKQPICRIQDSGIMKVHPELQLTSAQPIYAKAIATCLEEAAQAQMNRNHEVAMEKQAELNREAFREELKDRIASKRSLLNAQLDAAMEADDLETAEDLMITLAGMGDKTATELLAELSDAS